uniref:U1-type domain-containing protein n=1 Tax=Pavo cristatus TaxID=9049 RepID=A0A8C9FJE9_PAVCR
RIISSFLLNRDSEKELAADSTEEKKEREKKQTNFTLCNVCNIQLNSAAQAQIHYNGKSHQKRLKQLSNGNLKSDNGKPTQCLSVAMQPHNSTRSHEDEVV